MMDVRWPALVICTALLALSGCGGGQSTSKAYDHFIAASNAITAGDKETAFKELSLSLETSPSPWSYFQRARIYLERGQESEAAADCQKGLELSPKDAKLLWLTGEMKKPAAQRFKGKFANPPGAGK